MSTLTVGAYRRMCGLDDDAPDDDALSRRQRFRDWMTEQGLTGRHTFQFTFHDELHRDADGNLVACQVLCYVEKPGEPDQLRTHRAGVGGLIDGGLIVDVESRVFELTAPPPEFVHDYCVP